MKKKWKSSKKESRKGVQLSGDRLSLLVIDNEPIRKKALSKYHQAERNLEKTRQEILRFETVDLTAFQRWEAQAFGSTLTEVRELQAILTENERLIFEIEDESVFGGCSEVEAYRRVMERKNRPPGEDPEDDVASEPHRDDSDEDNPYYQTNRPFLFGKSDLPPDFDVDVYDKLTKDQQRKIRNEFEMMRTLYEAMTGFLAPELEEILAEERAKRHGTAHVRHERHPKQPPKDERLKILYRKLVRQLHPDGNKNLTVRERQLWHEVQEAYKSGDLERMLAIEGLMELGVAGFTTSLPVQILKRMTEDLLRTLQNLKRTLKQAQKHPAWKFGQPGSDATSYAKQRRRELQSIKDKTQWEVTRIKDHLERLAKKAEAISLRRKTKPSESVTPPEKKSKPSRSDPPFEDLLGLFGE